MHQALYRKYRPKTFDEVIGQEHITSVLSWEVANHKVNHAYVFCGSAGTGKTSCAKILAKAVNCEHPINGNPCNECYSCKQIDAGASIEVIEMDAASNTGVDYIREIREDVIFTPSEQGIKVYIIDEVHMLSESAFNALLKTLEEPPQNVIFVLATTEIQDIPATILSRCQRFDFKRLTSDDIIKRLNYIAKQESFYLEPNAAFLLAHLAQGGMRDAVSLFELCLDQDGRVTESGVREAAGIVGRETIIQTVKAITLGQADVLFDIIADIHRSSKDLSVFFSDLISFYRDMLVQKVLKIQKFEDLNRQILDLSARDFDSVKELSVAFTREKIIYHIKLLEEAYISMAKSDVKRTTAEITLMRMATSRYDSSYEALEARIAELENAPVRTEMTPSTPSTPTEKSTAPKSDTANGNTPQKKQEAETRAVSQPSIKQTSSDKSVAEWIDIIDAYTAKDPSVSSFLKNSKATINSDTHVLTVWVLDGFAKAMLDRGGADKTILSLAPKFGLTVSSVNITLRPKQISEDDPLSDLI